MTHPDQLAINPIKEGDPNEVLLWSTVREKLWGSLPQSSAIQAGDVNN